MSLLERLPDDEVELAATCSVVAVDFVEAVAPVHAEQTEDGQEDADTDTGRAFEVEWAIVLEGAPTIASFGKGKSVDGGLWLQCDGVAELHGVLVVDVAIVGVGGACTRCKRGVFVATESDCFFAVGAVARHAVATHDVFFEWRFFVAVVVAEESHFELAHEDEFAVGREWFEDLSFETPLVILDELVEYVGAVFVAPVAIGES